MGNIVLNTEERHDIRHTFQNDDAISDDETIQYDMVLEDENYEVNKGGSDYMPITEGKVEISTCKQLQESLDKVEKEDCAMRSRLGTEYRGRGCCDASSWWKYLLVLLNMLSISPTIYDDRYNP